MKVKNYVLGLAFSADKKKVVLMLKNKPDWQSGKYNGVGGKIDPLDTYPVDAMVREFHEETGVVTTRGMWQLFVTLIHETETDRIILHCFRMFSDLICHCTTMEEEKVCLVDMDYYNLKGLIYYKYSIKNLHTLIPMAMDTDFISGELKANLLG